MIQIPSIDEIALMTKVERKRAQMLMGALLRQVERSAIALDVYGIDEREASPQEIRNIATHLAWQQGIDREAAQHRADLIWAVA